MTVCIALKTYVTCVFAWLVHNCTRWDFEVRNWKLHLGAEAADSNRTPADVPNRLGAACN